MRTILLLILSLSFYAQSAAQENITGYMGNKYSIGVDVLSLPLVNMSLHAKYCFQIHGALSVQYTWESFTNIDEVGYVDPTSNTYIEDDATETFRMHEFEINYLRNFQKNNQSMPIGVYSGTGLTYGTGGATYAILGSNVEDFEYSIQRYGLNVIYGRVFALAPNLNLDLSFTYKFILNRVERVDGDPELIKRGDELNLQRTNYSGIIQVLAPDFYDPFFDASSTGLEVNFFYFRPQLRISYMF